MIAIDGSMGEGGGQILRSALSLALLTGKPFTITNIRAARSTPGLRAQHVAAISAAASISHAVVAGDSVGSQKMTFEPGPISSGRYHFDIGTAGATSLVLQTILLPLALQEAPTHLFITGGTHVPWSPCFHYLDWHWRVLLARMGIDFDLTLQRAGFYPKGGGEVDAMIPGQARPHVIDLKQRGALQRLRGLSGVANLPPEIAERQRHQMLLRLHTLTTQVEPDIMVESFDAYSRGTVVVLLAEFEQSQACFAALGARGKPAERVADEAVDAFAKFLQSDGAVDPWLADQLLLPLAVANDFAQIRTSAVTQHLLTNAEVIGYFLPVKIEMDGVVGKSALVSIMPG